MKAGNKIVSLHLEYKHQTGLVIDVSIDLLLPSPLRLFSSLLSLLFNVALKQCVSGLQVSEDPNLNLCTHCAFHSVDIG